MQESGCLGMGGFGMRERGSCGLEKTSQKLEVMGRSNKS